MALRLVLLGLATLVSAVVLVRSQKSLRVLPPLWWPWVLWAAWAALSLSWSVEPARSLKEWQNEVFYTALALFVCHLAAQAPGAVRPFFLATTAGTTVACLSAILAFSQGLEFDPTVGWYGGPQDHSASILTLMPCALATLWYGGRARWPRRLIWTTGSLIALFVISAYATQNRTVWVGFALQIAVFAGALLLRRLGELRTQLFIALAGSALIATTATIMLRVQAERESTTGAYSMSADPRFTIWPKAIEHIEQRPLTGYGFGRGLLRDQLRAEANHELAWHAHNLFLDISLQVGITGVLLFLVLLAATLRQGLRFAADPSAASAACGIALIGVLAGMGARNMTDVLLVRQNSLLFWSVIGVLLAWGERWKAR